MHCCWSFWSVRPLGMLYTRSPYFARTTKEPPLFALFQSHRAYTLVVPQGDISESPHSLLVLRLRGRAPTSSVMSRVQRGSVISPHCLPILLHNHDCHDRGKVNGLGVVPETRNSCNSTLGSKAPFHKHLVHFPRLCIYINTISLLLIYPFLSFSFTPSFCPTLPSTQSNSIHLSNKENSGDIVDSNIMLHTPITTSNPPLSLLGKNEESKGYPQ